MEKMIDFLSMVAEELGSVQISTVGVTLIIGILNCFLGYRLLKAWVGLTGFTAGALLAYSLVSRYTGNTLVQIGAIVSGGLLLGLLAFHIYRLGVFLLCTTIGTTAVSILLQPKDSLRFLICLGIGVLIGLLGMAFVKPMVILNTALGGGFSIAASVAGLLKQEADLKILILGAVLASTGIGVQIAASRNQDKKSNQ